MKYIQLYRTGKEMIGSDGCMKVDGRFNIESIREAVIARNKSYEKNFPHLIATSFAICQGRIWASPGRQIIV